MKTFFRFCLLLVYGAFFGCIGAGIENHRTTLHAADIVSLIVIGNQGAISITKDGTLASVKSPEEAVAIAKKLSDGHLIGVPIRCTQEQQL